MARAVRRAERSLDAPRIRYSRVGVTGLVGTIALLLIIVVGAILDARGASSDVRKFGEWAAGARLKPVDAIVNAARGHRFVFVSDIYSSLETKRLATDAIAAIARGPGLDAVVLEVGHDLQPLIDRYLDTTPENAAMLLSEPRVLGSPSGGNHGLLDLYHQVWQLNSELGADRRIHILAADLKNWPAVRAESPALSARRFAERDAAMMKNLEDELLERTPRARVFVFMTGLHALKSTEGQLQTGGVATVETKWFADRLAERYPGEVQSVLVDAPGSGSTDELVTYNGTRIPEVAKAKMPSGQYALPIGSQFNVFSHALRENSIPGLRFELTPRDYRLPDLADLYVYLGRSQ
jgi:hypothetical protein